MSTENIPYIIRNIVGRCHACDSNLSVIRCFISRTKRESWDALPRDERRNILRMVIDAHNDDTALFAFVMRGYAVAEED